MDNFIEYSYRASLIFKPNTGCLYKNKYFICSIYTNLIDNTIPLNSIKLTSKMIQLINLFNYPFVNDLNLGLHLVNFTTNDVKNYIERLNEYKSEVLLKICFVVRRANLKRRNRRHIIETGILDVIEDIIKNNYPIIYKKILFEYRLGS